PESARLRVISMKMRMLTLLVCLYIGLTAAQSAFAARPHGRARIFVLMIWDGLRPDFVTQRDTPNLFALARDGVRFDRHHSAYPTLTMVNAVVLATGVAPGVDGILCHVI